MTVRVKPPPMRVMVAVRKAVTLLASKVAVSVVLPLPLAALRVSQSASSEVVQLVLLAMEKLVEPAVLPTD